MLIGLIKLFLLALRFDCTSKTCDICKFKIKDLVVFEKSVLKNIYNFILSEPTLLKKRFIRLLLDKVDVTLYCAVSLKAIRQTKRMQSHNTNVVQIKLSKIKKITTYSISISFYYSTQQYLRFSDSNKFMQQLSEAATRGVL